MRNRHLPWVVTFAIFVDVEVSVAGLEVVEFFAVGCGVAMAEQAFTPSLHVWSNALSPGCPQFPRQDPPGPQQVSVPSLLRPHLGHSEKWGEGDVFVDYDMNGVLKRYPSLVTIVSRARNKYLGLIDHA